MFHPYRWWFDLERAAAVRLEMTVSEPAAPNPQTTMRTILYQALCMQLSTVIFSLLSFTFEIISIMRFRRGFRLRSLAGLASRTLFCINRIVLTLS